ncbi:MAG: phosphonate ABC transporter, permease protein PhnE [Deltaproteobacteria bacterium]|nr:phosphonate ABC transporter, permease protein PhnE [Deltaproteobacteria bacterium]
MARAFIFDWGLVFYGLLLVWHFGSLWRGEAAKGALPLLEISVFSTLLVILATWYGATPGRKLLGLSQQVQPRWYRLLWIFFSLMIALLTLVQGWRATQVDVAALLNRDGFDGVLRIGSALLSPQLSIFDKAIRALIETIYIALMATLLAVPVAFVVGFFGSQNLMTVTRWGSFVYSVVRFFLNLTRSIEPIIWAIIFSVWVGIGPFAGMLALALHSVASLGKLYSEQIESIDQGPLEAITATGAHSLQVVWYGVVPQVFLPFLSFTIYRWDINVRMATVIGLVGGGGIGTMLMQYQGLGRWNEVGTIIILIAIAVWAMDFASAKLRAAIS